MANNNHYWVDKEQRAKRAQDHTNLMSRLYGSYIDQSISKSVIYRSGNFREEIEKNGKWPEMIVENVDTVTAILNQQDSPKLAALNFASYKNPGGMFLKGSRAQEECLCHESFLYNVLVARQDYYDWNNEFKNKALYLNRAIYSPNIFFYRTGNNIETKMRFCDVITCAAPNYTAASKYQNVTKTENSKELDSRIKFVLDIASDQNVETLILGAFGCGVFGQDPIEVAKLFKKHLEGRNFNKVIFAVPGYDANFTAFNAVYGKRRSIWILRNCPYAN